MSGHEVGKNYLLLPHAPLLSLSLSLSLSHTHTHTLSMATTTAPESQNPRKHSDLDSKPPATGDALSTQAQESSDGVDDQSKVKSVAAAAVSSGVNEGGAVTDIQKKMKRAERFGMPVQLSEEEKRNSRAERFGTGSAGNGLDSSKSSEELKRKARAERFGIVQSDPSDEEAKKKARLARFGSFSKTDAVEEEKKKARAIRFSQLGSVTKENAKVNVDVKTAIAGEAGGGT